MFLTLTTTTTATTKQVILIGQLALEIKCYQVMRSMGQGTKLWPVWSIEQVQYTPAYSLQEEAMIETWNFLGYMNGAVSPVRPDVNNNYCRHLPRYLQFKTTVILRPS